MGCTAQSVVQKTPWLRCSQAEDAVTLADVDSVIRYEGTASRVLPVLLPWLTGRRTIADVADRLSMSHRVDLLVRLCQRLVDDGFARLVDQGMPDLDAADERLPNVLPSPPLESSFPVPSKIRVVGATDEIAAMKAVAPVDWDVTGANWRALDPDDDAVVVAWIAEPNAPEVAAWNETAYLGRRPWLPISGYDGQVAVVGPYVHPPHTPCYECYRRRRASRGSLGEESLKLAQVTPFRLTTKPFTQTLAAIAMIQLQLWVDHRHPNIPGAVQTVTLQEGLSVEKEYVLRVPRCGACRPAARITRPAPWAAYFDIEVG